jgi:hypothetical protein
MAQAQGSDRRRERMNLLICKLLLGVFGTMLVLPFTLCLIDCYMGSHLSCKWFGWHNGQGGPSFHDGCSLHAVCSKCGAKVMQDSQGNWFD